jgi:D-glycero-alpha-D-manno-heptose-7-phosphate kinase
MVITQTPYRISLFGGGTDLPPWYRQYGGAVLSTTIDKYCYISCRVLPPFFEHRIRVVYSKVESVMKVSDIQHPAVRGVMEFLDVNEGLEVHHDGDLPARSGMGSSSAFTVGFINAIYALRGEVIGKEDLAYQAIDAEQNVMKENVGCQDQVAAAFGGLNHISFRPDDSFHVRPIILTKERYRSLNSHLLLFFTGFTRISSDIAKTHLENINKKEQHLHRMGAIVDEATEILTKNGDITLLGEMLHEGWMLKRDISSKVSTSTLDEIYELGIKAGAKGGKILGSGGGGFMLFFAKPEDHPAIRNALSPLLEVPFSFDFNGSRVIFYNPSLNIY